MYYSFDLRKILTSTLLALGLGLSSTVSFITPPNLVATALTPIEVKNKAKAREVTVIIQALENDSYGSGVIVRRSGNTYTVLTANHVLSGSSQFAIRTFDEATYNLKDIRPIAGVDMAIVTFESAEVYPTAQLGDSNKLKETEATYVCGYPKPSEGIPIPLWVITQGNIIGLANKHSREGFGEGYAIAYSNLTRAGMAGGPVFNNNGELIAIHGKTSTADKSWVNLAMPINLYTTAIVTPQLSSSSQISENPDSSKLRVNPKSPKLTTNIQTDTITKTSSSNSSQTRIRNELKTALIIGNSSYQQVGKLLNPVNDAQDLADALKDLGFDVTLLKDAGYHQMNEALDQFSQKLLKGSVGVFYYAGHGIQFEGENYLLPVDAKLGEQRDLIYEALPVSKVLNVMEKVKDNANILILDACRNNPFKQKWLHSIHSLGGLFGGVPGKDGLAPIKAVKGSYIAYATAPGKIAFDGQKRNGTFTTYLLKNIKTPNLGIEELFKRVRAGVAEETNDRQVPWDSSSLVGSFSFNPQ